MKYLTADGYNYTGLDVSSYIVQELSQKYPGFKFLEHDISEPLPLEFKVRLVIGLEVLEHVVRPQIALKNLYAVLENGGVLIFSVPNPDSKIPLTDWKRDKTHVSVLRQGEWVTLAQEAGFRSIHATTIFSLPYLWHFGKIFSRFFTVKNIGASILLIASK